MSFAKMVRKSFNKKTRAQTLALLVLTSALVQLIVGTDGGIYKIQKKIASISVYSQPSPN